MRLLNSRQEKGREIGIQYWRYAPFSPREQLPLTNLRPQGDADDLQRVADVATRHRANLERLSARGYLSILSCPSPFLAHLAGRFPKPVVH